MNVVREDNKDKPATWKQVWCLIYAICGVERGKTKNPPLTQACFIDVKELWKAGKLPRGAVSEILSLWKEADLEQIDAAREQALLTEGFELLVEMVGRDFKWPNYTKELQDQEKPKAEVIQLKEKVTTPDAEKLTAVVALVQDLLKDYAK
jgi:hypothetical protein